MARQPSVKERLKRFFLQHQGQIVNAQQLQEVAAPNTEWARRIRELRGDEGWPIQPIWAKVSIGWLGRPLNLEPIHSRAAFLRPSVPAFWKATVTPANLAGQRWEMLTQTGGLYVCTWITMTHTVLAEALTTGICASCVLPAIRGPGTSLHSLPHGSGCCRNFDGRQETIKSELWIG